MPENRQLPIRKVRILTSMVGRVQSRGTGRCFAPTPKSSGNSSLAFSPICPLFAIMFDKTMELMFRPTILLVAILAGILLFTPYEAFLEGIIAVAIVMAAVAGSLMHPRREVYYVQISMPSTDPSRRHALEQDFLAVKVELVRLWLLFVPTFLAVAVLTFFAADGLMKFSFLNWIFSSSYVQNAVFFWQYPPLLVLFLLSTWIEERRVMRDARACNAHLVRTSRTRIGGIGQVSYAFLGEHGEYYGGYCLALGPAQPRELATIVFHNVRKPPVNKIAMGFLFHRVIILGHGVTDLDKQTMAAQMALAEPTPLS